MGQDVKLLKNEDGIYDIPVSNGDFETVDGIETAIGASLFTDARADVGDVRDAFRRRGFSGNLLTILEDYRLGGELWTLDQVRLTQDSLNDAQDKVKKSLQFLIDDGVADNIEVNVTEQTRGAQIEIILFKDMTVVDRFTTIWNKTQPIG